MYEIREMLPEDLPAVTALWKARVRWAEYRGIGLIRYCPLTAAEKAAAQPCVLTCDGAVVATATIVDQTPHAGWTAREAAQPAVGLVRMVTDPELAADRLSWVITSWARDRAARTGHAWIRMRVAPSHLARHLSEHLACGFVHGKQQRFDSSLGGTTTGGASRLREATQAPGKQCPRHERPRPAVS
ncbi:hypothetical protein [Streptomyces sp. BE133]|uniref:hypothetical protein n=1 Tax=Streptomyces sp. BE133 TaxID=3002523 RepID=UPI002E79A832|nr:hypothetical protein [Streptomyces sp. BE133]MEE1807638.1 hypothetical protein [Streptomyces sp. BE133]